MQMGVPTGANIPISISVVMFRCWAIDANNARINLRARLNVILEETDQTQSPTPFR
jgi:hypothetical protein